jgi:hypothetical protein
VLGAALRNADDKAVFAAQLQTASGHEIAELRLGKKAEQLYAECERLHRQLDRTATGSRRSASPRRRSTVPAPPAS